jgi:hypothetical protein
LAFLRFCFFSLRAAARSPGSFCRPWPHGLGQGEPQGQNGRQKPAQYFRMSASLTQGGKDGGSAPVDCPTVHDDAPGRPAGEAAPGGYCKSAPRRFWSKPSTRAHPRRPPGAGHVQGAARAMSACTAAPRANRKGRSRWPRRSRPGPSAQGKR